MNILVDTGFWYSYLGTREIERHKVASDIYRYLDSMRARFIIPFPTLYETVNTKLLKEKKAKESTWFLKELNSNPRFVKIPDERYKDEAYKRTVTENKRGISLVDNILRVMMEDKVNINIDGLITFNSEDFFQFKWCLCEYLKYNANRYIDEDIIKRASEKLNIKDGESFYVPNPEMSITLVGEFIF